MYNLSNLMLQPTAVFYDFCQMDITMLKLKVKYICTKNMVYYNHMFDPFISRELNRFLQMVHLSS